MPNRSLRKKLQSGEKVIGTWCEIPSCEVINVLAKAGLDFVIIDLEHGSADFNLTLKMVMAAQAENCYSLVRIPKNDQADILRTLETGADGIIVPHVESIQDRVKAIKYAKYPPVGQRSLNPYTRAGSYQFSKDYTREQNKKTLVGLIIEGLGGINHIEEIIDDENVDLVYIGAYDISASLGVPGDTKNPQVFSTLKQLVRIIKSKNKIAGCLFHDEEELKIFLRMGIQFLCYKVDTSVIFDEFIRMKKIANL